MMAKEDQLQFSRTRRGKRFMLLHVGLAAVQIDLDVSKFAEGEEETNKFKALMKKEAD